MRKSSNVQMCRSSHVECIVFLSQKSSGVVLMECTHEGEQTDKQGLYQSHNRITIKEAGPNSYYKTYLIWQFLRELERFSESTLFIQSDLMLNYTVTDLTPRRLYHHTYVEYSNLAFVLLHIQFRQYACSMCTRTHVRACSEETSPTK